MANSFGTNPIYIDTDTANPLDIGLTGFGNSDTLFFVESMEWQNAANGETINVTDNDGLSVFSQTFTTGDPLTLTKYFNGKPIKGLKVAQGSLGSGTLSILLM